MGAPLRELLVAAALAFLAFGLCWNAVAECGDMARELRGLGIGGDRFEVARRRLGLAALNVVAGACVARGAMAVLAAAWR